MKIALWSPGFSSLFILHVTVTWQELRANQIALFQECVVDPVFIFCLFFRKCSQKVWPTRFSFNSKNRVDHSFFSCLIWQICCCLWSFLSGCCDTRAIHLHTIITSFVFLSFSTGLSRKAIKGKFYPNISSISSSK